MVLVKGVMLKNTEGIAPFLEKQEHTQLVNAKYALCETLVLHSVEQALKAFRNRENIAGNGGLEFLLRLAGERQISRALEMLGAKKGVKSYVFVSWNKDAGDVYKAFKKQFKPVEKPFPKTVSREKLLDAMEKSATFWLGA